MRTLFTLLESVLINTQGKVATAFLLVFENSGFKSFNFRFIILELLSGGDLKSFLRESRSKPVSKNKILLREGFK